MSESSSIDRKFNVEGIPCADNAIDVICHGRQLHIIFLERGIHILTDEPIKKKINQVIDLQGFKRLIELDYENDDKKDESNDTG